MSESHEILELKSELARLRLKLTKLSGMTPESRPSVPLVMPTPVSNPAFLQSEFLRSRTGRLGMRLWLAYNRLYRVPFLGSLLMACRRVVGLVASGVRRVIPLK